MKNSLKIASKTKSRVRFVCEKLNKNSDERAIEAELLKYSNITKVRVNRFAKSVIVSFDGEISNVEKIVNDLDFPRLKSTKEISSKDEIYKSALTLLASKLLNSNTISQKAILALMSLYTSYPLLKEGFGDLKDKKLTSRVLEALAVSVSLARMDFLAANGTNLLLNIGEYIEETTVHKSDDLIKELAKPSVSEVWIETHKDGKKELNLIKYEELKVGDIVVARTGETIAIDGYIVDGSASINQASITGESAPADKKIGDRVISGTVVENGVIKIWAEHTGSDTATARIKNYIQTSLNEKSATGLKATKLADKLVPVTLGLSVLSYFINKTTLSVASVLQADYSCALKLATPVVFKTSIANLGKNGILIKGAKAIEAISVADTFVFDKTGTLTHGNLSVVEIRSFSDEFSDKDLLNLTASAEEHYFHPVAKAIVDAAKQQGFSHMHHDEVEFIVAHGIKTRINGKEVLIGSRHFLQDDKMIDFSKAQNYIDEALKKGLTLLYVGYHGDLIGVIVMQDDIRQNAKATIQKLKELGVKRTVMLTGDIESKAKEVAKTLGIDKIYANCLPTQKAEIIEELKAGGAKVVFVGDGINDAPSLVKADAGISMLQGADIAKASADISLLKDDISMIAYIKEISNKTMDKININFNATVVVNSAILIGATLGRFSPLQTAFLHNGTTVLLLLNSLKGIK
ncbi:MAG: heavy metal translocating P-type ATPase [Campylobacter sp.]|nr:heavy metal translocating P-type ATPase [Campylobacter sp.]